MSEGLWTYADVMAYLKVSRTYVEGLVRSGQLVPIYLPPSNAAALRRHGKHNIPRFDPDQVRALARSST